MRGQPEVAALRRALDEAMRGAAWKRASHPERCDILARAVCWAFAPRSGRRQPSLAVLAATLEQSERDQRIRSHRRSGLSNTTIAERFGLSDRQVRRICAAGN